MNLRQERQLPKHAVYTIPVCVDLDGTLVNTNTLHETFLATLGRPNALSALPVWLRAGKARLKQELARRANLDPALLPYNESLLAYLHAQKQAGQRLILVTAADQSLAEKVSAHLGLFDEVIASDGRRNLRGAEKAKVLVERFGSRGFVYAGNDHTDLAVWREAASAILVNVSPAVARTTAALVPVDLQVERRQALGRALLEALRPYQWVKNCLVFVPIITANALMDMTTWLHAFVLFLAFCAVASSLYFLNDLTDLAADRQHPRKKARPFARGALPITTGLVFMPVLFLGGSGLAIASGAGWIVLLYALLSLAYSLWLKALPLVDVFVLAILYTLRVFAGGEVTGHRVSLWLLAFSSFFFFSLAIVKRVSELMLRQNKVQAIARRGYTQDDLTILQFMGVSASFVAALVLALYVQSPEIAGRYVRPALLWFIVPSVLFWECHIWLATVRGQMHDDPIIYAARDWTSRLIGVSLVLILLLAATPL